MLKAKQRALVLLSLMAFLMNVVLPFYAVSSIDAVIERTKAAAEDNRLAELLGDKILICTSTGYKWVSVTELLADNTQLDHENSVGPQDRENRHNAFECPLCYLASDEADVQLGSEAKLAWGELRPSDSVRWLSSSDYPAKQSILLNGGFTRAPPTALT